MNIERIDSINEKIQEKTQEIIRCMKVYSPYNILCSIINYLKGTVILDDENKISEYDKMEMQFCIEIIYGLIACIDNDDFDNGELDDESINKIIIICEDLFKLKHQAVMAIGLKNNAMGEKTKNYIFEDILRKDITGKRYDYFEKAHHKNVLNPLKKYIEKHYLLDIEDVIEGIEKLKGEAIFGFKKALDKMEKNVDKSRCKQEDSIDDKLLAEFQEAYNNAFCMDSFNISKNTNWPKEFIEVFTTKVGDEKVDLSNIDIMTILKIQNTISSKPIIEIDGDYYFIRLPRLLDNFDRILLKDLYKKTEKEEIKKIFSSSIESYTKSIFEEIFQKSAQYYQNNYYKRKGRIIENDLIIEVDDYIIIVEIKSSSFTPDLAYENIDSHVKTLETLITKPSNQISEIESELKEKGKLDIYDSNRKDANLKKTFYIKDYKQIFKMAVTFEGFNEITARAEKIGIINLEEDIIVCSIDDLEVYGDFFKKEPINFVNYMTNRVDATHHKLINLNDELDHLGLYLCCGNYSMRVDEIINEHKKIGIAWFDGFREDINRYYNDKYFGNETIKPRLEYPQNIQRIIEYMNNNVIKHGIYIGNNIISLSGEGQEEINSKIVDMIEFAKTTGRIKHMGIQINRCILIISCDISKFKDEKKLIQECYANLKISSVDEAYAIFITFDEKENINEIKTYHLTKHDYQYKIDEEIEILSYLLKNKRSQQSIPRRKIGRNEPCICGSGIKYKKCCGK